MKTIKELGISPAPWKNNGVDNNPLGFVRIIDKDGFFVADVDGESDENQHANAHFIAAAPKLYRTLREAIIEKCASCPSFNCGRCQGWRSECKAKRWRSILAEASGEVSNG